MFEIVSDAHSPSQVETLVCESLLMIVGWHLIRSESWYSNNHRRELQMAADEGEFMLKLIARKGLMTTCLTLLMLAWAILLTAVIARAEETPLAHIVCQTQEFSPNVDLEIRHQNDKMVLNMILTDDSGMNSAISDSQINISATDIKVLTEKRSGVFKMIDPISGPQLLALKDGNGYISLNAKGQTAVIDLKNCK